jgi:hypothetical protein
MPNRSEAMTRVVRHDNYRAEQVSHRAAAELTSDIQAFAKAVIAKVSIYEEGRREGFRRGRPVTSVRGRRQQ